MKKKQFKMDAPIETLKTDYSLRQLIFYFLN